jgi:hypothetical protein
MAQWLVKVVILWPLKVMMLRLVVMQMVRG